MVKQLQQHNAVLPEAALDQAWMDYATRSSKLTVEKLEAELKNYKNNLIKESIRVNSSASKQLTVDGAHGPR